MNNYYIYYLKKSILSTTLYEWTQQTHLLGQSALILLCEIFEIQPRFRIHQIRSTLPRRHHQLSNFFVECWTMDMQEVPFDGFSTPKTDSANPWMTFQ